ncbi:MAG: hypothetical protein NPINA01_18430 [Nitrospinaceae bacterium]|nr:MAG: hypothetical protein NPINA01_18430 [Nitrospinaceae bacterium]
MGSTRKLISPKYKVSPIGGFLFAGFLLSVILACTNDLDEGTPLGPSLAGVQVLPANGQVQKLGTLTFTTRGGVAPFSFTISTTTIGTIDPATGVFSAANTAGAATITAQDAGGATGTASVTVLANTTLGVSPNAGVVAVGGTLTFTAVGATAPVFWTTSPGTGGTIVIGTGVFTATAAGTETITVVDSAGNTGTTTVTIP